MHDSHVNAFAVVVVRADTKPVFVVVNVTASATANAHTNVGQAAKSRAVAAVTATLS